MSAEEIGKSPDCTGCIEVDPRVEAILGVPEEEGDMEEGEGDMEDEEEFVQVVPDWRQGTEYQTAK